jgi:hypothetical protein
MFAVAGVGMIFSALVGVLLFFMGRSHPHF